MTVEGLLLGMRLILSLAVLSLSNSAGDAKPSGDCSSVFLGSLSESYAVHIPSTGIYHSLDGTTHHDHRVYKHTNGHAYMYFMKTRQSWQRVWAVGPEVGSDKTEMATSAEDNDTPEVAQQKWRLRNNDRKSRSSPVTGLKAVCVDDEFGPCTSGRLRMSGVSVNYNLQKMSMGSYLLTTRVYRLRPVYKHEYLNEYLYYTLDGDDVGRWIVGPEVGKFNGGLFVFDYALRPEFIFATWKVFIGENGVFANDSGVKLECQGVDVPEKHSHESKPQKGKPEKEIEDGFSFKNHRRIGLTGEPECDSTCDHGGHCQLSDPDEFRCICTERYFGLYCEEDIDCGQPPLVSGQQPVSTTGHYIFDVAFYKCPANTKLDGPPGIICQVDRKWSDPPKCLDRRRFGHHHDA